MDVFIPVEQVVGRERRGFLFGFGGQFLVLLCLGLLLGIRVDWLGDFFLELVELDVVLFRGTHVVGFVLSESVGSAAVEFAGLRVVDFLLEFVDHGGDAPLLAVLLVLVDEVLDEQQILLRLPRALGFAEPRPPDHVLGFLCIGGRLLVLGLMRLLTTSSTSYISTIYY